MIAVHLVLETKQSPIAVALGCSACSCITCMQSTPWFAQVAGGMPAVRKGAVMRMQTFDMAEKPCGRSRSTAGPRTHSAKHLPQERSGDAC